MDTSTIRPLTSADKPTVTHWLRTYLEQHRVWWAEAYATPPKVDLEHVVKREWDDLLRTSQETRGYVGVATKGATVLGVVMANLRTDRYLGIELGVLSWIYVAEAARGQGVANILMEAADHWMHEKGVEGREVFVTEANHTAIRLYERFGYRITDSRMLGAFPETRKGDKLWNKVQHITLRGEDDAHTARSDHAARDVPLCRQRVG